MPNDLYISLWQVRLHTRRLLGPWKEASQIIAGRYNGQVHFSYQVEKDERQKPSFVADATVSFTKEEHINRFEKSDFYQEAEEFGFGNVDYINPARLDLHIGLIPTILEQHQSLQSNIIFLPLSSSMNEEIQYCARNAKAANHFENVVREFGERFKPGDPEYADIVERGESIVKAAYASAPAGPV
jgi:hypothetical protein